MPRRIVLSAAERERLLAPPSNEAEMIRRYTFSETDHALIRQRRGQANRLGFAVQLCLLRYPGVALARGRMVSDTLIHWIAQQLWLDTAVWADYGHRDETRREHLQILLGYLGLSPFGLAAFRGVVGELTEVALQSDKGVVLVSHALQWLREHRIVIPTMAVVECACAYAMARANRRLYRQLTSPLTSAHRQRLDELLALMPDSQTTWLAWLRTSPLKPNSRSMLDHIERLRCLQALELPEGMGRTIHQNRLLKMAREGAQMTPRDLGKFETQRRYTPQLLAVLKFHAVAAAQPVLDAIETLRAMNTTRSKAIPKDAPTAFVTPRWRPLVFSEDGIDRRFYEICALSELKNALRAGDIWVEGSRQFRNFDAYLMPAESFDTLARQNQLPLAVNPDGNQYLEERLTELERQLVAVSALAADDALPDATLTDKGLKLTPQKTVVPADAQQLVDQTAQLLPRIKITDLLMDVDDWIGFTQHFVHLKSGQAAPDRALLLSAILADGINLGLTKMAESCPGITYGRLSGSRLGTSVMKRTRRPWQS